ncbi:hypothetical protein [Pedobacter sp. N23S346]|uniref:hypothetical protein n=1 Tax=Pedobacter sp. N23S346 TaxID=3402750 RepID=UPI003AC34F4D
MAVLHKKEEKIQAVLGRLPKKYTDEQFVEMFIRLYSKDWGKIKSAYIKQSQDKEKGSIINMPKPEIYLKQVLANYLQNADAPKAAEVKEEVVKVPETKVEKPKVTAKKEAEAAEETEAPKKAKAPAKKKIEAVEEPVAEVKKTKAPAKKKAETIEEPVAEVKKTKAPAKKKVEKAEDASAEINKPKAATKKPAAKK